jgi:hypothetical protein
MPSPPNRRCTDRLLTGGSRAESFAMLSAPLCVQKAPKLGVRHQTRKKIIGDYGNSVVTAEAGIQGSG